MRRKFKTIQNEHADKGLYYLCKVLEMKSLRHESCWLRVIYEWKSRG